MFIVIVLLALIGIIALAPQFNTDSRDPGAGHSESSPDLPSHDAPVIVRLR